MEEGLYVTFKGDADPLEKAASSAERSMKRFNTTADKTGQALSKMSVKSNGAGQAVLDLSRIASDAPYGFMAISNNIEQAMGSFSRLKAETGSVGGALKSLGSSLIGPAGIGLAFSVASALIIKYGDTLFNSKTASEAAAEAIEKQKKALESFVQTLGDLDKARVVGSQNAQEELVKLQALYTATQNTNLSYVERKKAVDALQEQYPKYFANMSDEAILAGKGKKAYDSLRDAILAAAKARAAQDIMVDIQKQVLAIEEKQAVLQADKAKADVEASKQAELAAKSANKNFDKFNTAVVKASTAQATANAKTKESIDLEKQRQALLERGNKLSQYVQVTVQSSGVDALTGGLKEKIKQAKPIKEKIQFEPSWDFINIDWAKDVPKVFERQSIAEEFSKGIKKQFEGQSENLGVLDNPEDIQERILFQYQRVLEGLGVKIPRTITIDGVKIDIEDIEASEMTNKQLEEGLKNLEDRARSAAESISATLENIQVEALAGVGEAIGQALSGGDVGSVFQGMFSVIGNGLQQLGKTLIQTSGLVKAFKASFTALGPAGMAAAGVGLIAVGVALKNNVPKLASGGIIPPGFEGDRFPAMLNSGEAVIPLEKIHKYVSSGNNGPVHVTGRLRGNDMVLQNSRTNRKQRRTT